MAFTIDCIVAGMKIIPLQINLSHGGEIHSGGIDAVIYYVSSTYKKEYCILERKNVISFLLSTPFDFEEELNMPPLNKSEFNIPKETIVLITVSHHLEERLSEEFLEVLTKILKENPQVYYLAVGGGNLTRQRNILEENGLSDRVIFTGPRKDAFFLTRMADIYLNEFPAGSGCAVLEAMACGKPIVAMHYSDAHTHSIGTNYIGMDLAIKSKDYLSYIEFANRLIKDEEYRKYIGKKMRKRYEENILQGKL
jgi:glycosyltransferase involved in cell wall biosynthesis